jgi:hypothetical protein
MKIFFATVLCAILLSAAAIDSASAADVDVYAEGAYTATDLDLYVYADINTVTLKSFGVKVNYNPNVLAVATATKNGAEWYMGDGVTNYPYAAPETGTAGQVVIIGGLLDTNTPLTGVSGQRKLLGKIKFTRLDVSTDFGIGLTLGKAGSYANFVTTDAIELDDTGVCFSGLAGCVVVNEIHERGDANGDGVINGADRSAVKYFMVNSGIEYCWMDCNGDGVINGADRSCIKYKMTN